MKHIFVSDIHMGSFKNKKQLDRYNKKLNKILKNIESGKYTGDYLNRLPSVMLTEKKWKQLMKSFMKTMALVNGKVRLGLTLWYRLARVTKIENLKRLIAD